MSESIRCLAMDPPWQEHGGAGRGCQNHYGTMSKQEIFATLMGCEHHGQFQRKSSCHLWIWVTDNFLRDGLWLMDVLGFRYVRTMVWVKVTGHQEWREDRPHRVFQNLELQIGLGQYLRGSHELCLLGTRGDAMVPEPADRMPSVIFAPRTTHSTKPEEAYQLIERVSPGPRLEFFARAPRSGWSVWGDQAP